MTVRLIALLSLITGLVLLMIFVPGGIAPTVAQSQQDPVDAAFSAAQYVHGGVANAALNATTTDAQDVELVGHIAGRINDIVVQGNYAYVGEEQRPALLDISKLASPTVLGKTPMLPDVKWNVPVAEDYTYVADGAGGVFVLRYTAEKPTPIPTPTSKPNQQERQIAYEDGGDIWIIKEDGSNAMPITSGGKNCCPSWSPDGNYLYFIRKIDDDTGVISEYDLLKEKERHFDLAELDIELSRVAVSPDGKLLAFVHNLPMDLPFPMHSHMACLSILELASEESFDLDCVKGVTWYQPVFSPSGDEVAVAAAIGIDASAIIIVPLDGSGSTMLASCCTSPDYLPDTSTLAIVASPSTDIIGPGPNGEYGIYRLDPTTKGLSPMFLSENQLIETADILEDGLRVVYQGYESFSDWPQNPIIEVLDLDTGETKFVTAGQAPVWRPAAPRGPSEGGIAYIGEDGNVWLLTVEVGENRKLTIDGSEEFPYQIAGWAPDDSMLAFVRKDDHAEPRLFVADVKTGQVLDLGNGHSPAWSPDSTRIAFFTYASGVGDEVFVVNTDGTNRMKIGEGYSPEWEPGLHWTAEGDSLIYPVLSRDVEKHEIVTVRADTGERTASIDLPIEYTEITEFSFSPISDWGAVWHYFSEGMGEGYTIKIDGPVMWELEAQGQPLGDWSSDGQRFAFQTTNTSFPGEGDIRVLDVSSGEVLTIVTEGGINPRWSPTGEWIAFSTWQGGLRLVSPNGANSRILLPDASEGFLEPRYSWPDDHLLGYYTSLDTRPSWNSDGTWVAFPHEGTIYIVRAATGEAIPVANGWSPIWQPLVPDSVDLSVSEITPIQVLEGQPLVVGKDTAVKVVINKTGNESVDDVQVRLIRGTDVLTSFYVSEPDNWDDQFRLRQDNTTYPLNFTATETSKTIYFFGDALTPTEAGTYKVVAEVDPLNLIPETHETKNTTTTTTTTTYTARWGQHYPALDLVFVAVEQWPSQLVIDCAREQTDFIEATYPVAAKDLDDGVAILPYYRIPGSYGIPGDRSPTEDGLDEVFGMLWLFGKFHDLFADRVVGIASAGWLHQNYPFIGEGVQARSALPIPAVIVELGSGPNAASHEVGHTYGLGVPCEEYDADCDGESDNSGNAVYGGLRLSGHTVMNHNDKIGTTVTHTVYCFMGTAEYDPPDPDRFVCAKDYSALAEQSGYGRQVPGSSTVEDGILLVTGIVGKDDSAEFLDWYRLPQGAPDEVVPGSYVLRALDGQGEVLHELPFTMTFTLMGMGETVHTLKEAPFAFAIPFIPGTVEFELQHEGQILTTRTVSTHAPIVEVLTPNGGEALAGSSTIEWTANDADSDTLSYVVLLSTDDGATWNTAAVGLTTTAYSLDVSALPPGTGNLVKIIATDGVNTGQDVSDGPFTIGEVQSEEEKEKGPAAQPRCCPGLGGLVALPVIMAVLRARRRSSSSV